MNRCNFGPGFALYRLFLPVNIVIRMNRLRTTAALLLITSWLGTQTLPANEESFPENAISANGFLLRNPDARNKLFGLFNYSYYAVELEAGTTFHTRVWSHHFSPLLILHSPDSDLFWVNGRMDSDTATLSVEIPEDGEYRLWVTSYMPGKSGSFTLSYGPDHNAPHLTIIPPLPPTTRRQTHEVTDRLRNTQAFPKLPDGTALRVYSFEAIEGARVNISLQSTQFDPFLYLIGPGNWSAFNDDFENEGLDSRIHGTLPTAGTYWIFASSYAPEEIGEFQLNVTGTGIDQFSAIVTTTAETPPYARKSIRRVQIDSGPVEIAEFKVDSPTRLNMHINHPFYQSESGGYPIDIPTARLFSQNLYFQLVGPMEGMTQSWPLEGSIISGSQFRTNILLPTRGTYRLVVHNGSPARFMDGYIQYSLIPLSPKP